jgi:hypothetical protein
MVPCIELSLVPLLLVARPVSQPYHDTIVMHCINPTSARPSAARPPSWSSSYNSPSPTCAAEGACTSSYFAASHRAAKPKSCSCALSTAGTTARYLRRKVYGDYEVVAALCRGGWGKPYMVHADQP